MFIIKFITGSYYKDLQSDDTISTVQDIESARKFSDENLLVEISSGRLNSTNYQILEYEIPKKKFTVDVERVETWTAEVEVEARTQVEAEAIVEAKFEDSWGSAVDHEGDYSTCESSVIPKSRPYRLVEALYKLEK
jgi:hypothetical protein